jgi:homoserine kinase
VPPRETRDLRELLRYRQNLVKQRSALQNRVHSLLAEDGYTSPFTDLFGREGRRWLADVALREQQRFQHRFNLLCTLHPAVCTLPTVKLTIRAPATSANLGPGFDCMGLAVDIWGTATVESGRSDGSTDHGVTRLIWQGIQAAFRDVASSPQVSITWDNGIPIARGLGASAALRVAGLLAGNALLDGIHSTERLLELGTGLEGFPDNMSPCLFGGFQVNVRRADGSVIHLKSKLPEDLQVIVFVPDFEMPTHESRRKLPKELSREDSIFNTSRVGLLISALSIGRYDFLDEATQDRIHQPARSEIFPGLNPIMEAARSGGAAAAYLSGGGSTVAAFTNDNAERIARLMTQASIAAGFSGRSIITEPTDIGAYLVE